MKQLKKPTKKQAILIASQNVGKDASKKLNPKIWLVERDTREEMIIVSRTGKQKRCIPK